MQNTTFGTATVISLVYWAGLHRILLGQATSWSGLLLLAVPGHTLNLVACVVDCVVTARPTR